MGFNYPPMTIFNERKRSIGEGESSKIFMQISVEMRDYLNVFSPSAWMVFTYISLLTDSEGWCFPNIDTIADRTGLNKDTVSKAIQELEQLNINGSKVLLKVNKKLATGRFTNNRYLIFPSTADIEIYADDNAKQIILPIKVEEEKPRIPDDCLVIPESNGDSLKKRYTKALKLYEESIKTKKKLINSEGQRVNNTGIINGLIMEIHGRQWRAESSRIAQLIKLAGNHWKLLDIVLDTAGQEVKGNPLSWIEGTIKYKNKKEAPNTTSDIEKLSQQIILAPGETYKERLDVLESMLITNDKFNLWKSVEKRNEAEAQIRKIKELIQ